MHFKNIKMIKLERTFTPLFLNPIESKALTDRFKLTSESVWNIADLKWALLQSSFGKCAYCECKLGEESKYMEVEHFKHKDKYPDDVVSWQNLLPSCKRCNVKKGIHDITIEPIVDPYTIDPKKHLGFRLYRLRGLSNIGVSTIETLDLNNHEKLLIKRFEIGEQLHHAIDEATERLRSYSDNKSTRNKNRLVAQVFSILSECQRNKSYAATASTIVCNDPDFVFVVDSIKLLGLWDNELEDLDKNTRLNSLPWV